MNQLHRGHSRAGRYSRIAATGLTGLLAGSTAVTLVNWAPFAQAGVSTPVQDTFARTVSGGWGSADVGGAWSVSSAANFSTDGTSGIINHTAAGKRLYATLGRSDLLDGTATAQFSASKAPVGYGQVFALVQRRQLDGEDLEARVRVQAGGATFVSFIRRDASGKEIAVGTETPVALAAADQAALAAGNKGLHLAFAVAGGPATSLQARAWADGNPEPTTWQLQATDNSGFVTGFGAAGLSTMTSSSTSNIPVA